MQELKQPNFIIAGERRSGTTTLAKLLEQHPQLYMYPSMDMAYFMDDDLRGRKVWLDGKVDSLLWDEKHSLAEYFNYFSAASENEIAIGEKSADYLFLESCHQRIKRFIPDVKIILTFRNPVERAWSHYWNEVGKGRESETFEKAIELENSRIEASDYARAHLSYISRGFYINSFSRLLSVFDRSQIKVVFLEELQLNPGLIVKDVFDFLGIDSSFKIKHSRPSYNSNWTTIPKPFWQKNKVNRAFEKLLNNAIARTITVFVKDVYKRRALLTMLESLTRNTKKDFTMNPKTRSKLQRVFLPSIEGLEQELDKDLSFWK